MENKLPLVLYFPGKWVYRVFVKPHFAIKEIQRMLKMEKIIFIYNQTILKMSRTFSFYGFKGNEIIIAIPETRATTSKWYTNSIENDSLNEKIHSLINTSTTIESVRIRDLQISKMEKKPKAFRKLLFLQRQHDLNEGFTCESTPTVVPETNHLKMKISTAPLPCFWNHNSIHKDSIVSNREDGIGEVESDVQVKPEPSDSVGTLEK